MKSQLTLVILVSLCAAASAACSSEEPQTPAPPPSASTPPASPTTGDAPSGGEPFAPITSRSGGNGQASDEGTPIVAPGANFTLPGNWISEQPSSSMRLAQARIPGSGGDGQLTVFYFGPGGGGGLESNLSRWIGQVEIEPGTEPRRESFDAGTFRVTWVEVQGTIKPSTMGVGPTEPQPGSRLLAAVVEGPQGPWYFKATGPSETMAAQRDAFLAMLSSAAPHG